MKDKKCHCLPNLTIKLCDFKMDLIKWQLNFGSCNFGLKSYLWFQIELALRAPSILKWRVWFQTKLHSTQFNYHYKLDGSGYVCSLSGSPAKSGPLDFETKNNFTSFFVREKGFAHIYKKTIYYFPVSYFCFATSQNCILAELRLPTVIRKVKFTDFCEACYVP